MVNASTNSTAEARNAAVAIAHCMQLFSYSGVWRYLVSGPGTVLSRQCIAISYLIVTYGRVRLLNASVWQCSLRICWLPTTFVSLIPYCQHNFFQLEDHSAFYTEAPII